MRQELQTFIMLMWYAYIWYKWVLYVDSQKLMPIITSKYNRVCIPLYTGKNNWGIIWKG